MDVQAELRIQRILWGSLTSAPIIFVVVMLVTPLEAAPGDVAMPMVVAAGLMAVASPLLSLFAGGRIIARMAAARTAPPAAVARTGLLLRAALCEGAALAVAVAFTLAQLPVVLTLLAFPYAGLVAAFPTEEKLRDLERRMQA